jgi:hypothetical protein
MTISHLSYDVTLIVIHRRHDEPVENSIGMRATERDAEAAPAPQGDGAIPPASRRHSAATKYQRIHDLSAPFADRAATQKMLASMRLCCCRMTAKAF